ncbi:hypothetical protein QI305_12100 [Staphylococcus saprophyticus]|nr:hypothetical protein [Staphylococcus saprophyticus]
MKQIIMGLVIIVILIVLAMFLLFVNTINIDKKITKEDNKTDYENFKEHTTVIKGTVKERYIQNDSGKQLRYLVVAYNGNSSKLVKVNEEQFHKYKQGANVNFRIHREKNNEVVVDLKQDKDIKDKKSYENFKKEKNGEFWHEMRKATG